MRGNFRVFVSEIQRWATSLRFGSFSVLLVAVVLVAFISLAPTLTVYVQQRQEIAALREQVAEAKQQVRKQTDQINNWQDPAFVKAAARDRLFYVMPGEMQLGIINDVETAPDVKTDTNPELQAAQKNWSQYLLGSVVSAAKLPAEKQ